MGSLETEVGRKTRNTKIQKAILKTIAVAGFLSIALLAPNAFQILKIFDPKIGQKKKKYILRAKDRLIENGLIKWDGKNLCLTKKGEQKMAEIERFEYKIPQPKKWDGKWRVLIFDIPENKKNLREKIRFTLISMGFKKIQDSVWFFPYDCEDLIFLIKNDLKIGKELLYLIVEKIENEEYLKKLFGL